MPTYQELIAAGGVPVQAPVPAPGPGTGLSYDQLVAMGGTAVEAQGQGQGQAPEPSGLEAFGRGAVQGLTSGFADEIVGAAQSLFGDSTYEQARNESRASFDAAREAHPWLYGGGDLAGGFAQSFAPGMNVAGKGAGLAKVVGTAAAQGGLVGLGESKADLIHGDVGGALLDTAHGAITAGTIAPVLHGLGSRQAARAEKQFQGDIVADAMSRSRGKDFQQAQRIIESEPGRVKDILHSEDFSPVQKAMRSGDTETARTEVGKYIEKVSTNRTKDWDTLDKVMPDVGVSTGSVIDRVDNQIQKLGYEHGQSDVVKVLKSVRDRLEQNWSTAEKDFVVSYLEKTGAGSLASKVAGLEAKTVTGKDLFRLAESEAVDGIVPKQIRDAIGGIEFKYNPEARVPGKELREALTKSQDEAVAALGTIAETEHARLKAAPKEILDKAMDVFLDKAKARGGEAAEIAEKIIDRNKKLSIALAFENGLEQKAKKELGGSQGLGKSLSDQAGTVLKGLGVGSLLTGNFGAAAATIAAPYAMKAAKTGARVGNDMLANIIYHAEQGNPWAMKQLEALRRTPAGIAKLAAAMKVQGREPEAGPGPGPSGIAQNIQEL